MRFAVFPPDQVVIEDTWNVSGLRGTGSHHVRVRGGFVPAARTHPTPGRGPCLDELIARIPPPFVTR